MSFALLRQATLRLPSTSIAKPLVSLRFATTASSAPKTEPGKKVAPHDGVPFAAPPRDDTKGELGQVFLPDMESIEHVKDPAIQIPGEPDNYSFAPLDPDTDSFPHAQQPKVFTVSSVDTHLGGGPQATNKDDPIIEVPKEEHAAQQPSSTTTSSSGNDSVPLTEDERKGLLVLAGIVVGGFAVGSLTNRKMVTKVEIRE